jgi:eukaryotic-like serine/threonine-protein kinase
MTRNERDASLLAASDERESVDSLLREAVAISEPAHVALSFALMPGDVLAERFVVERLASSGGMGAIYRGSERVTGAPVAIKVMASAASSGANRFAQEAVVLAELSHPAIVRYLAHGTTPQGTLFLAMEWLEGEDLAARLARAPLSLTESLSIIRSACEGVAVAHQREIVHRDIKPSNLFLVGGDASAVKVLDFGIARQRESARTVTQSGTLLGTVGYMSPEQAMGPRDVDARADVFALGCVLFECLTGRAAFVGQNAVAVLAKVLHEQPPRLRELRPELGEALESLVASMLAKKPDERPQDAAAILLALERGDSALLPRVPTPVPAPSRKAGRVGLLALAGALIAAVLAGFIASRPAVMPVPVPVRAPAARTKATLLETNTQPLPTLVPETTSARVPGVTASAAPRKVQARLRILAPISSLASGATTTAPSSSSGRPSRAQTGGLIEDVPF